MPSFDKLGTISSHSSQGDNKVQCDYEQLLQESVAQEEPMNISAFQDAPFQHSAAQLSDIKMRSSISHQTTGAWEIQEGGQRESAPALASSTSDVGTASLPVNVQDFDPNPPEGGKRTPMEVIVYATPDLEGLTRTLSSYVSRISRTSRNTIA